MSTPNNPLISKLHHPSITHHFHQQLARMNQLTQVKHFRAHHTTARWILDDWSEFNNVSGNCVKSEEFHLNKSGVPCLLRMVFNELGEAVLDFVVGSRSQPASMYMTLLMVNCDQKKEVFMCNQKVSLPADEGIGYISFEIEDSPSVGRCSKQDSVNIVCEIYEQTSSDGEEKDEGFVHEHNVEGGGEARMLDDLRSHDGNDDTDDTEEGDDDGKSYEDRFVMMDYDQLYRDQELCDLTIVVVDKAFMCHTFVLAAISPYMAHLIRHTRACYSLRRHIDLSNETWLSPDLAQAFLEYAYGAKSVLELRHLVFELMLLAIKFQVRKLKYDCESYLCDNMNTFNVTRIICLAHQYGCQFLKAEAIAFARTCLENLRFFGKLEALRSDPLLYCEVVGSEELHNIIV